MWGGDCVNRKRRLIKQRQAQAESEASVVLKNNRRRDNIPPPVVNTSLLLLKYPEYVGENLEAVSEVTDIDSGTSIC